MADDSTPAPRKSDPSKSKKRKWGNTSIRHGSQRNPKSDLGRNEYQRQNTDRRERNEEDANRKRQKLEQQLESEGKQSFLPKPFSEEEIAAEERRPKHKVAVMIGYSGTGYKGMQINTTEKTIEGDLFSAFVAAKAISKANASDPKKSALVRCARTDKGVHAAGNVISLKLIVEDEDIVEKINSHLSPQIRVWGIVRTVNSFSSYQACDSRQYEYLIPTHSFISPHPSSWLAKRLVEFADEAGDRENFEKRQKEMQGYWEKVEEEYIKPILEKIPENIKAKVVEALYETDTIVSHMPSESDSTTDQPKEPAADQNALSASDKKTMDIHIREIRNAYRAAKRTYRIPNARLERIQPLLDAFLGTKNFHNYTVDKPFSDPSAKRVIKSFRVNPEPIVIDGTEWLSIKIWGQSFMMHQIRKMVGMVALSIRCGADPARIPESFGPVEAAIPKAPSLGLLLERPIFSSYNDKQASKFGRDPLDFAPYEAEMTAFKQREIYERMYREENEENAFHGFFAHVDNWRIESFLWLSSMGFEAVARERKKRLASGKPAAESEDKADPEDHESDRDQGEDADKEDGIKEGSKDEDPGKEHE